MIRTILILVICFLYFESAYSSETDTSILYRELCSFLVSENKIQAKDTVGIAPFLLLYISNLLEDNEVRLHDNFGVYIFNRIGLEDDIDYILIKRDDSYAVFKKNDPLSILTYLFTIKEKYPQTLDSDRLNEYVEKIIKINQRPIIGIPKGKLLFYFARKQ